MKAIITLTIVVLIAGCSAPQESPVNKTQLLDQLKNSYDNQNWFVPLKNATEGLTAEQANWKDSTGNHSIGQLVSHLIFWNERNLIAFQGNKPADFSGNNNETFDKYNATDWNQARARLDSIHTTLYDMIEDATDTELKDWSTDIANISAHNAYHTGQIIYIRKMKGWWDPEKGVK
jgi:hypothetical protein